MGTITKQLWRDRQAEERAARETAIATAWALYEGRHPQPLTPKPGQINDSIIVNLARPIVDRGISFLFGKDVRWQLDETGAADSEAEQYLAAIWDANAKHELLHEVAQNGALSGLAAIKVDPQPDGRHQLINLDPASLTLAWSHHNIRDIWRYRIQYTAADDLGDELHVRQDITRAADGRTWLIEDVQQRADGPWLKINETPWPYPLAPVVTCKNLPAANSVWGYHDLEDAKLNEALNLIASTTRKTLRLHAHPRLFGRGFTAKTLDAWGPEDMWSTENTEADIKTLEMQSDLSAARNFYLDLRAALYATARMPDLSSFQGNLGALTNFGLRVLFADLLEKTDTKRVLYGGLITRLNTLLLMIEGYPSDRRQTLTWPDPLPVNALEKAQEVQTKQASGLVSDETLTGELGYTYADEQARLAQQAATAPSGLPPGGAATPGAPMFQIGDRVAITVPPHMPGQTTGTIALIDGNAYGIIFDGMESMGVHKWYVAAELKRITSRAATATPATPAMAGM